jgi:hypothetical protein
MAFFERRLFWEACLRSARHKGQSRDLHVHWAREVAVPPTPHYPCKFTLTFGKRMFPVPQYIAPLRTDQRLL